MSVIKAIMQYAQDISGHRNLVKVAAPTGNAASLFSGGETLHSMLKIPAEKWFSEPLEDLVGEPLADLQKKFKDTQVLIIDEKGMVGLGRLAQINKRLKQAKPEQQELPFGGITILLSGDFRQLPPVLDLALYSESGGTTFQCEGRVLYRMFDISICLKQSMRQAGDENAEFRSELERLATGEFSVDDWKKWAKCNLQQMSDERKRNFYENGTKLCAMKKNMNAFNISHLKKTGSPIAKIKAVNSLGAVKFPADKAQGLSNVLYLSKGARIVLTNNIWAEAKLVNGSRGTVRYIIYEDGKLPPHDQPAFIICHFPDYIGPSYLRTEDKLVPLVPMTRSWFKKNKQFSRIQYPIILGWAITIHKSQGMTLDEIILDVGEKEFATGLTYTGAKRTRNFGLLAFDPFPNYHRFAKIFLSKGFKSRRKEELRKLKMAADQM